MTDAAQHCNGSNVIRVAIIGANPDYGWGSAVHRRVIQALPDFTLHAICTTREESARQAAASFDAPLWFTDAFEVTRHPDIDLVAICVKAPHHYAIARAALRARKHVYCEWPLAFTVAQAEELPALAQAQGVRAMIGLHLRGSPAMRTAAQYITDGYVGNIFSISLQARLFGPVMRAMALRAGGTTLLSIYGGHLLDAMDHYGGGITDIRMNGAVHLPPVDETGAAIARDAFDHLQFHGRLANGALFMMDMSGVSMTGMGCMWRIDGDEGSLILSTRDPSLPAIESLVLRGARHGGAFEELAISGDFDCPAIPALPDRYAAYPGSFASREALSAIGNLYTELGSAIRSGGVVAPDFQRAAHIQTWLAPLEASSPSSLPTDLTGEII